MCEVLVILLCSVIFIHLLAMFPVIWLNVWSVAQKLINRLEIWGLETAHRVTGYTQQAPTMCWVFENNNMAPTSHTRFSCDWQCYKMPFHLCALHNPNPLEFVFTKQQTPQLSVEHLVVCLHEYFQKLLFLSENIKTSKRGCLWLCLFDTVFNFAKNLS